MTTTPLVFANVLADEEGHLLFLNQVEAQRLHLRFECRGRVHRLSILDIATIPLVLGGVFMKVGQHKVDVSVG